MGCGSSKPAAPSLPISLESFFQGLGLLPNVITSIRPVIEQIGATEPEELADLLAEDGPPEGKEYVQAILELLPLAKQKKFKAALRELRTMIRPNQVTPATASTSTPTLQTRSSRGRCSVCNQTVYDTQARRKDMDTNSYQHEACLIDGDKAQGRRTRAEFNTVPIGTYGDYKAAAEEAARLERAAKATAAAAEAARLKMGVEAKAAVERAARLKVQADAKAAAEEAARLERAAKATAAAAEAARLKMGVEAKAAVERAARLKVQADAKAAAEEAARLEREAKATAAAAEAARLKMEVEAKADRLKVQADAQAAAEEAARLNALRRVTCEVCEDGNGKPATWRCDEGSCEHYLCDECNVDEHTSRKTKTHVRTPVTHNAMQPSIILCQLCEDGNGKPATWRCDEGSCEHYLCDECNVDEHTSRKTKAHVRTPVTNASVVNSAAAGSNAVEYLEAELNTFDDRLTELDGLSNAGGNVTPQQSLVLSAGAPPPKKPLLPGGQHAFLSYQWDVQGQVKEIKDLLNERNVKCTNPGRRFLILC